MDGESRIAQWRSSAADWLNDQEWYQQIQEKWAELDAQSQFYIKSAGAVVGALLILGFTLNFVLGVRSLRQDLEDKNELLSMIQTGNEELRRLRDTNQAMSGDAGPWNTYLETQATTAGLDRTSVIVSAEKGSDSSEHAKETRYDIDVKKVNIRQLVRYAFSLENGTRPVKLRYLSVDTGNETTGYLNATISVSAFSVNQTEKGK
jgi:hypothetical protein